MSNQTKKDAPIEVVTSCTSAAQISKLAQSLNDLVSAYVEIHKIILEKDASKLGYVDDGSIGEEDFRLLEVDDQLSRIDIGGALETINSFEFGTGAASELLIEGIMTADSVNVDLVAACENMSYTSILKADNLIQIVLSDLSYSFYRIFGLDLIISAIKSKKDYKIGQYLQYWVSNYNVNLTKLAMTYFGYASIYVPSKNITDAYADDWKSALRNVNPEVRNDLIDLSDYVYLTDLVALRLGTLTADDQFVEVLRRRDNTPNSFAREEPKLWTLFLEHVPEKLAHTVAKYEPVIDIKVIQSVLNGRKYDESLVDELEDKFTTLTSEFMS